MKKALLSLGLIFLFAGCGKKVAEDTTGSALDAVAASVDVTPVDAADVATPTIPQDVTK